MAGLHFDITGDNSNFLRKLDEARNGVRTTSKQIEESGTSIEQMFGRLAKGAATLGLGFSATQLIKNIVEVRGQFQQLEIAFETMLKSKEKATALMGQLSETAAKTPFDLQSVAQGAKQLLAYGTASEEVNDTLVRLGNIASGLSIPLGDMVYLYGTTQVQGRLFTQDVRQFMGRGIPLVKELAAELGKTEQQINEMVTAGQIGFPQVEKVIRNMTSENGQFYNLMEKQSQSLTGQISNLGDAWDGMLNKIGTQTQGVASAGIYAVTSLIENYEEVGVVLASLVASYGTYKAAIIVVNTLERANIMIMRQAIIEKKLAAAANITLSNSMAVAAARGKMFALVQRNIISSLKGIGSTLANPYVLLGAAVGAATYGLYKFYTRETEVERMQRQYNDTKESAVRRESEHKAKVDELISSLEDETTAQMERVGAIEALKQLYPGIIEKYIDEEGHLKNLIALNKELAEFQVTKKVEQNKTDLHSYDERIKNQEEYINRMRTNDQSAFDDEVAKLDELKRQRELSRANVAADYINKSIDGSKSMSDDELKSTINAYQKALSENKNGEWFDTEQEFKVEDINRYISALKNLQTARDTAVHDKEYWENLKKETQSQLDALSGIEAAGKKGDALKDKIAGYDNEINAFSVNTSKQESAAAKLREQQEKLALLMDKQASEQIRSTEDLWNEVWQAQIDSMDDGSEKTLTQMELNHKKELRAIDRQKEDLLQKKKDQAEAVFNQKENEAVAKNPNHVKQTFDGSGITLDETTNTQFDDKYKAALDKQAKERQAYFDAEKQAMNEYLAAYGDYEKKREAIIAQGEEKKKGKNVWEQKSVDEETKKLLAGVDDEVQKKTSIITQLFSDMSKRTVADMRLIADQAQQTLDYVNAGEFETDDSGKGLFGLTKEQFDILSKSPEKLQAIKDEIANVRKEADASETAFNKVGNGLKKVFSAGDDTKKLKEGLEEISQGMNDVMQAGQFLSDSLSQLGDALGSGVLSGIAEGLNVAMDAMSSTMDGAKAGAMFGPIGAAAGAAIGLVSSLASSIAKIHDAKNEKRITVLQDQIEVLEKSYDKLGNSVEKAYSKDASKLINQQNTLLEQQKVLIRNQIAEERDKKKTDDGRIKEWEQQIEDINKLIDDNKDKQIDAIFGEDIKSSIDNFAQAYADAWASNEDRTKSAKDVVKDMMRQMVTESIKAAIQSSQSMEKIRAKLQSFYADNILSGWEQDYIYNMAESLQKELDDKFGWADSLMKGEEESTSQDSTKGMSQSMDQDTGNELNGRFTAFQISNEGIRTSTEEIKNSMLSMLVSMNLMSVSVSNNGIVLVEIRNLMISSNSYLEDIAKYTKVLMLFGDKLDSIANNTKGLTSR